MAQAVSMQAMLQKYERGNFHVNYSQLADRIAAVYQPVWNVPRNYMTGYKAKYEFPLPETETAGGVITRRNFCRVADIALFIRAARDLEDALNRNERAVVIVPVNIDTLNRFPFRNYFLQYCRELPEAVRAHLVLQIEGIQPDTEGYRIREILFEPAKFVRSVIISSELRRTQFQNLAGLRHHAVSVSLNSVPADETLAMAMLNRIADKAKSLGCLCMAEDIHTRSLMCAAIAAGFTYIAGPAVRADQIDIDGVTPLDLYDIYNSANKLPA